MGNKCLILLVGLPYSGKSTWARQQPNPIVSPDAIRLALHGQRFAGIAEPFVWAIAKLMVRALFMAGHSTVVLDATNTTRKRRDEWRDDAWDRRYEIMREDADTCRNRAREVNDADILPIIDRMAEQQETIQADERDAA